MKNIGIFLLVVAIAYFGPSCGQTLNYQQAQHQILEFILDPAKYDPRIRPNGHVNSTGPVIVTTNLYVRKFEEMDDLKMDYGVQLTFRTQWNDDRLAFSDQMVSYINLNTPERIWTPDVFFSNELKSRNHNLLHPNTLIRIYPSGDILFSTRISLRLSCPMNLRRFPHDDQICAIVMPSYSYTTDDLVLIWKEVDPVQVTKSIYLPKFNLISYNTGSCTARTATGQYSCLKLDFQFRRELQSYLTTVYIPSIMIILISYLHFWLSPLAISGRILLALGSLLAMAYGCIDLSHTLLQTSYTKAIDVWTGICLTFLFVSLIEFVAIHYIARRQMQQKESGVAVLGLSKDGTMTTIAVESPKTDTGDAESQEPKVQAFGKQWRNMFASLPTPERIDVIARFAYPLIFLLFNLIYWAKYLPTESG